MGWRRTASSIGTFGFLMCQPSCDRAQEIAPFKLLGVDGYVSSKLVQDEFVNDQGSGQQSRQLHFDLRQEVMLMTHSYVYHPNLLLLDIGGGPILQQGHLDTDSSRQKSSGLLYNLSARATFLRDKPYRGALFYDHLNPTLNIGPGEVMNQQSTRYGAEAMLLEPASPVPINFDASRTSYTGSGAQRVVDDRIDQFSLRGTYSHAGLGSTYMRLLATRQASATGSSNLPIQNTSSDSREMSADTRLSFGDEKRYEVSSIFNLGTQDYAMTQGTLPSRKDMRLLLSGRGRHDGNIQSYANANHSNSTQGSLDTTLDALAAGVTLPYGKHVQASGAVRADSTRGNQLRATTYGGDGSLQYQGMTGMGSVNAGVGARYTVRDQQAGTPQTAVIGERVRLTGTAPVPLGNSRVVGGSLVVSNTSRTQTFVEGLDYAVTILGTQTRVQRRVGGNILDGQEVLVDYAYDNGGTFGYTQLDNNLNVGWNPSRMLGFSYRFASSSPRVTSGAPTTPLNTVRDHTVGARADVPLQVGMEINVGGSYEVERRRETLAPFRRTSADAYAEAVEPFFQRGNLRVTLRQQKVDYDTSPLNVDLSAYDVRMSMRLDSGVDILADLSRERDHGGSSERTRSTAAVKALWRYRRFSLSAELARSKETQGDATRQRTLVQVFLRREFGR